MALNRRSFLLGSGLTAAGLIGSWLGEPDRAEAADSLKNTELQSTETPRSCRPKDSLSALLQGNERFAAAWQTSNTATTMAGRAEAMSSLWINGCYLRGNTLISGQAPWASILSCADSRVSPEWIFDAVPADLFVIRSAGNTAFDAAIASLEFGVSVLKTPLIMVMGHSECGAVKAARESLPLTPLLEELVTPIRGSLIQGGDLEESIKSNAKSTAKQLTQRSQLLKDAEADGLLTIVVSYFDIQSGKVTLL